MPELPDIVLYLASLESRVVGQSLKRVQLRSPFFLRTFDPPIKQFEGLVVRGLRRLGKRVVFEFEDEQFLVFHLMVSGRFRWREKDKPRLGGKIVLAEFEFPQGVLFITEASKKKRASLHCLVGEATLKAMDPGGLEIQDVPKQVFVERLQLRNHTLKRALTDPTLFSGIGNAYSDEILNAAELSPIAQTQKLSDEEIDRLHQSIIEALDTWTKRLVEQFKGRFPEAGEVTAFRPDFSAHGKFGKPCLRCGTTIQRIRYAENETNYCPRCQTGGKILADRSLSRILKNDWPRTIEELENLKGLS